MPNKGAPTQTKLLETRTSTYNKNSSLSQPTTGNPLQEAMCAKWNMPDITYNPLIAYHVAHNPLYTELGNNKTIATTPLLGCGLLRLVELELVEAHTVKPRLVLDHPDECIDVL